MSESDKAARRSAILEAAEQHLRGAGFEAFSMEVLGRQLGVARGTLYRYFATREAILLELYLAQRATFFASMMADVRPGMNDDEFLACWYRHATSDALLLVLQARLGSVIEHNIAPEHLLAAKLDMQRELDTVADHL
ncbi:MAG TPA: TetR family transcriptional regulator, partial [Pseudomonadales bacterium]